MKQEVKTSIEGLRVGMFVSRLDRPWIQTPFALEGMEIESKKDIERIRRYCAYVYVDMDKGPSPDPKYWVLGEPGAAQTAMRPAASEPTLARRAPASNEYTKLRKKTYSDTSSFGAESSPARQAASKLEGGLGKLMDDLSRGRELDVSTVKEGISAMVDSIIRNPSAMMWVNQVRKLDEYTYSRALGTSVWCATFGRHLGLERRDIEHLALGGLLLDIGKSRIPLGLLQKNRRLNGTEVKLMRTHVDRGVKLLVTLSQKTGREKIPVSVLQMIAAHHERADGSGYPQGLVNDDIPVFGRIAGIVDAYDAMTSKRPYAVGVAPKTPHEAIAELYELRQSLFQSELVEQFIQTVGLYPTGSLVELNTGEVGVVVATNGLRRLRPSVMLLLDADKNPMADFQHLDLSLPNVESRVKQGLSAGAYGIDMKELFL